MALARTHAILAAGIAAALLGACGATEASSVDPWERRGNVNGDSFELVTMVGSAEWSVRIRGDSMFVARARGEDIEEIGTFRLDRDQFDEVWKRIDTVDIPGVAEEDFVGLENADVVTMALRVPPGDHWTAYVPRDIVRDDPPMRQLLDYVAELIAIHADRKVEL